MNTTDLIAAHATAGHTITEAEAAAFLAQAELEADAWQAALAGATYDWQATRPYADQYQCSCCSGLARWAVEHMVDGKPDRLLYCDDSAASIEAGGLAPLVHLLTVEQTSTLAAWAAAGVGAN